MENYTGHQHHMFSNYQLPDALTQRHLPPTNRFVHINHPPPTTSSQRVFVNPHFKTAHKVPGPGAIYVNPLMYARPGPSKQIHINPNIRNVHIHINPNFASTKLPPPPPAVQKPKNLVVLTKTKLVRRSSDGGTRRIKRRNSVKSPYKIIRCHNSPKRLKKPVTPYTAKSRFKIDRRLKKSPGSASKKVYRNVVKMVKKQSSNHLSVVNISGVFYKKSRNTLRKTSTTSPRGKLPKPHKVTKSPPNKTILKKFKLVRGKTNRDSGRKLKKCNIPCPTYRKYGLCKGKDNGKCLWKHDPAQIALCTRFLQGACIKEKCPLSHNVSAEKMPTCKYYLEGTCSKENCPYLHVKISCKAEVCRDFLEGYCSKAVECDKRHQYLCPDYEKYGTCQKQRCPYPHGKMVRRYTINKQKFAKKCSEPKNVETLTENEKLRYYCDSKEEGTDAGACLKNYVGLQSRPKLGSLPSFIAFGDT